MTHLYEKLRELYGSHRRVAELLMIHEDYYCAVRSGRVEPSERLKRDIRRLAGEEN